MCSSLKMVRKGAELSNNPMTLCRRFRDFYHILAIVQILSRRFRDFNHVLAIVQDIAKISYTS
jgi:hypothetical protein